MKTLLLSTLIGSILSAAGQITSGSQKASGYIITNKKDTLHADFIFPSPEMMLSADTSWMLDRIIIADGEQSVELLPHQLSGFTYDRHYYETLSWPEASGTTPGVITRKFCRRILDGAIAVFSCNEVLHDKKGREVKAALYYKQDEKYNPARLFNFHCHLSRHILPHRELVQKAKDGNLTGDEFVAAVREYNKYLQPKTSY